MAVTTRMIDDAKLYRCWKASWEGSNQKNPYSASINRDLQKYGMGIHDIKVRLGLILAKRKDERTEAELALLDFDSMARAVAESSLVDQCGETTNGAIFLLESKYGYRKGTDINITANSDVVKKVVRWGDEDDSAQEASREAVNG